MASPSVGPRSAYLRHPRTPEPRRIALGRPAVEPLRPRDHGVEPVAVQVVTAQWMDLVRLQDRESVSPGTAHLAAVLLTRPAAAELRRVQQVFAVVPLRLLGRGVPAAHGTVADRPQRVRVPAGV